MKCLLCFLLLFSVRVQWTHLCYRFNWKKIIRFMISFYFPLQPYTAVPFWWGNLYILIPYREIIQRPDTGIGTIPYCTTHTRQHNIVQCSTGVTVNKRKILYDRNLRNLYRNIIIPYDLWCSSAVRHPTNRDTITRYGLSKGFNDRESMKR